VTTNLLRPSEDLHVIDAAVAIGQRGGANLREGAVQNVRAVAVGSHPRLHCMRGVALAPGQILANRAPRVMDRRDPITQRRVLRARQIVRELSGGEELVGLEFRRLHQSRIHAQRRQSCCRALVIREPDDRRGNRGGRGRRSRRRRGAGFERIRRGWRRARREHADKDQCGDEPDHTGRECKQWSPDKNEW